MKTKIAKDLKPGDKVKDDKGDFLKLRHVGKSFVRFATDDGGSEGGVYLEWQGGAWSNVPVSQVCEVR